jgi:ABC-2 type transport system permease protein
VFTTTMVQALIMVLVGVFAFKVEWLSDPLSVALIMVSYGLAVTGLGILMTTLARSRGQLSGLTAIFATGLSMIGGCYWAIELTPPAMQTLAKFTPTGWAMSGLVDVVYRHQGFESALMPAGVLLVFAAVFFAVGVKSLKFE